MKNMNNFAAQQLSKSQMNSVKGGWLCFIVTEYNEDGNEGYWVEVPGATNAQEAADRLGRVEGAVGHSC